MTEEHFDVVVVGLGPAGMLASEPLLEAGLRTLLIERSDRIGGAAFATDVNLQNITGFPPQSDFGERTLGSRTAADDLARAAYEVLHAYGLPRKPAAAQDEYSYAVDEPTLRRVVHAYQNRVQSAPNTELRLHTSLQTLDPGQTRRWRLLLSTPKGPQTVEADHVLLATGKLSALWLTDFLKKLQIPYQPRSTLALGFRVEALAATVNAVTQGYENPKIRIVRDGVVTETFCWCKNGRVMAYDFGGARLLDGEHCYGQPQVNTSFGVITTVELPAGSSNTEASVDFARYISTLGRGRVLLQRLGDLLRHRETTPEDLLDAPVQPSLTDLAPCDLSRYFPAVLIEGFLDLIAEINRRIPSALPDEALVYAPILERIFPDITLDTQLQTPHTGLFLIGDCSGKGVGVAPAAAMGLAAARHVVRSGR